MVQGIGEDQKRCWIDDIKTWIGLPSWDSINAIVIDDYAKDGGEELFTKMHCIL